MHAQSADSSPTAKHLVHVAMRLPVTSYVCCLIVPGVCFQCCNHDFFQTLSCNLQVGIAGHVASDQYGKYGIIREADLATKVSEFQQWATEVKKVNIEALPKWEEKELFAEFMEDYNTGTLPHKKYYDLMAYAQQQALKAAKKGRSAGVSLFALCMITLLALGVLIVIAGLHITSCCWWLVGLVQSIESI